MKKEIKIALYLGAVVLCVAPAVIIWSLRAIPPSPNAGSEASLSHPESPENTIPEPAAPVAPPRGQVRSGQTVKVPEQAGKPSVPGQHPAKGPVPRTKPALPAELARFANSSIPVADRVAEMKQLAERGDEKSILTLMQVGSAHTYLNYAAVEALGKVKTAKVTAYLETMTGDPDPRVIAAAVKSLASTRGHEAIPVIKEVLDDNHVRPDGFQDIVCSACVDTLGTIGSREAVPVLGAEFETTVGKTLHYDYGSRIVAALLAIRDPSAQAPLESYAARLKRDRDAMGDNPMGQRYLDTKIKEVNDVLAQIGRAAID